MGNRVLQKILSRADKHFEQLSVGSLVKAVNCSRDHRGLRQAILLRKGWTLLVDGHVSMARVYEVFVDGRTRTTEATVNDGEPYLNGWASAGINLNAGHVEWD